MTSMPELADRFETERLVVRELCEEDLEAILPVHVSNPEYLALTEGSAGEPGRYDLDMLQRDFVVAQLTPGRHMAGIFLKEGDQPIGVLDWMEENPSDGKPWVGLVIIRADRQRCGFAAEAFRGLADQLRTRGARVVRASISEANETGRAFAGRLGFEPISKESDADTRRGQVTVLERSLV